MRDLSPVELAEFLRRKYERKPVEGILALGDVDVLVPGRPRSKKPKAPSEPKKPKAPRGKQRAKLAREQAELDQAKSLGFL